MGVVCYFAAIRERSKFSPTTAPVVFWSIVLLLVIIPIVRYRLWTLTPAERRGRVIRLRDHLTRTERTDRNVGRVDRASDMAAVDSCTVYMRGEQGRELCVTVVRPERAELARAYYREGDTVVWYRGAAVPFNEDRLPPHPLCLGCGNVAKNHEERCPHCGMLLLQERAEEYAALCEEDEA